MLRHSAIGFFGNIDNKISDIDGNVYTFITVGNLQWLTQNLKTTKYADGTVIPNLTHVDDWIAEDSTPGHDGAYCWYDNDIANKYLYGALYNWPAVDNVKGLAPTGWRVATPTDFNSLINDLGGHLLSGGKLKETGLIYWNNPNGGATNEVGFNGRGSGSRTPEGNFLSLKEVFYLWTPTPYEYAPDITAYYIPLAQSANGYSDVTWFSVEHKYGFAVRCVRDIS